MVEVSTPTAQAISMAKSTTLGSLSKENSMEQA